MAATTSTGTGNGGQHISRVVHLRNIPSDMTDLELVHFCMPYGKLVNYLLLKGRNQVYMFIESFQISLFLINFNSPILMMNYDFSHYLSLFQLFAIF